MADKKISAKQEAAAGVIRKQFAGHEQGVIQLADGADPFEAYLPDGVDMDLYKKTQVARREFCTDAALAVGEEALAVMDKDSSLDQVSAHFKIGNGETYDVAVLRQGTVSYPKDGKTVSEQRPGYVQPAYRATFGKGSSSGISKVRTHIGSKAAELFGSK